MKINGNAIRPGNIVEHQGRLWRAVKIQHTQPGKGGAYLQVELKDIRTGTKMNERFRSSETVERVQLEQREYQFLYTSGDEYTFMDNESFEQVTLNADLIGEPVVFLQEGMTCTIESYEGSPISVELPETVVMTVVEADPVVRGQTAASSYKPAKLENGVRVMVPPHIETGMRLVVNTADASYVERAK
ncbi:MAG TPA: elongation factor P [Dongiaceae bacterium]|jgi:elongation factor P|nr:elongation factor P [Dongiaceae bacterium]